MSTLQTRLTALTQAIGADIKQLNGKVLASGPTPLDTWHILGAAGEPAFGTNIVAADLGDITFDVNDPQASPAFRKFPDGTVYLRGAVSVTVTTGSTGARAFTLPAGYRPPNMVVIDGTKVSGATLTPVRLKIRSTGVVSLPASVAGDAYVLDGVVFDTETVTSMLTGPKGDPGAAGAAGAVGPPGATGGNATIPIDPWHSVGAASEPAFYAPGGWTNGGGAEPLRFRKDPLGRVWVRGNVSGGLSNSGVFTLPSGYRPVRQMLFDNLQTGATAGTYLIVNTDGSVIPTTAASVAIWIDISFDTETVTQMPTGPKGDTGATGGNATIPLDTWHTLGAAGEPIFGTGWQHYAGGFQSVGFRKFPDGRVKLRGLAFLASGTGTLIFTLPSGYWPPGYVLSTGDASFESAAATLDIRVTPSNGQVTVTLPTGGWVSLDNVEFDTGTVAAMPSGPIGPTGPQGPAGGPILQDEGIVLPSRAALNFTGLRVAASDDSANNRTNVNVAPLPLLNAFPASPVDGQEAYIDALGPGGPTWHIRYRANHPGAYKWDVISSSNWLRSTPLGADFANTVVGTWQAQEAIAMTIYWPGIWEIAFGCAFWKRGAATADGYMGALFGSSIVGEVGMAQPRYYNSTAGGEEILLSEGNVEATLTGAAALRPAYFTSSALNSIGFRQGWLRCRPIRLLS